MQPNYDETIAQFMPKSHSAPHRLDAGLHFPPAAGKEAGSDNAVLDIPYYQPQINTLTEKI